MNDTDYSRLGKIVASLRTYHSSGTRVAKMVADLKQSLEGRVLRGILDEGEGEVRDEFLLVAEGRSLAIKELLDFIQALRRRCQTLPYLPTTGV